MLPLIIGENNIVTNITFLCRLFLPTYCFGDALYKIGFKELINSLDGLTGNDKYSVWHEKVSGKSFRYLIIEIIWYWILILIMEKVKNV